MPSLVALLLASYLVGSLPFSLWAGRLIRGIDLRTCGSGNLGATNAQRFLGWKIAAPVLLLDMAKGAVATLVVSHLRLPVGGAPPVALTAFWLALLAGAAAIAGHMWTPFARFRGGKGVATAGGVFLSLATVPTLCSLGVFLALTAITRFVSLGSVGAALLLPVFLVALTPHGTPRGPLLVIALPLVAVIVWKHRANIRRLLAGTEARIGAPRSADPRA